MTSFQNAVSLGAGDSAFMRELHALLDKHGNLDRFGLCLLHEHFAVGPGEILMESNDPAARTLACTVQRIDQLPPYKETAWRVNDDGTYTMFMACGEGPCDPTPQPTPQPTPPTQPPKTSAGSSSN